MSEVQVIEKDGEPAFYVLPAALWEKVREAVEDAEDAAAYSDAVARDDGVRYPAAVVQSMASGATALRSLREYKGLTLQALASAAGVGAAYVGQLESGKRIGTAATLNKLAIVLGVPLEALTP